MLSHRWIGGPTHLTHNLWWAGPHCLFLESTLSESNWICPFKRWVEVNQVQQTGPTHFDSSIVRWQLTKLYQLYLSHIFSQCEIKPSPFRLQLMQSQKRPQLSLFIFIISSPSIKNYITSTWYHSNTIIPPQPTVYNFTVMILKIWNCSVINNFPLNSKKSSFICVVSLFWQI